MDGNNTNMHVIQYIRMLDVHRDHYFLHVIIYIPLTN